MPDPLRIMTACAAAAAVAAAVLLVCAWPWRSPSRVRAALGGVLGAGAGFAIGCWRLGLTPHWPPREDQDRFLLILMPAVIAVELLASIAGPSAGGAAQEAGQRTERTSRWLVLLLRLVVAAVAARILLHNSGYLADLAGPGTRAWSPQKSALVLAALSGAVIAVWAALLLLARRTCCVAGAGASGTMRWGGGRSVVASVAVACGGGAMTVMLSGYASGGQLGLPLAAALMGIVIASLLIAGPLDLHGPLSIGVVGLFAVLVIGRFFGELASTHAALLGFAPLLAWLTELPRISRIGPRLRGVLRVVLTAVPVAFAVAQAQQAFVADSNSGPAGVLEPSLDDYMNY
jgi:hypothetical protein